MAHTKAAGTTRLGRDSASQRLGVKLFEGETARAGAIIIRQRGTKFRIGKNVRYGKDDTIYALRKGKVQFANKKITRYDGSKKQVKFVNVIA